MEILINTVVRPNTTCFDEDMLAKVYRKDSTCFTVFPSTFFNIEWLMSKTDRALEKEVQNSWFEAPLINEDYLFLDSFAWHWHNSSNKNKKIVEKSKFWRLEELTKERLKKVIQ